MTSLFTSGYARAARITIAVFAQAFFVLGTMANAEEKLSEPIFRVANETSAAQPATTNQTTIPAGATAAPAGAPAAGTTTANAAFDLTRKGDEHALMPVLRTLKMSQNELDANVRDYSCTLVKRERVDGELGEYQHIFLKVMHQPFSVYMSFLKPFTGREVLYVAGQNNGQLVVLDAGFKRMLGKMNLDPQGTLAMRGQKHPVTDVGIRNLTAKLTRMWEAETKFAECDVTTAADTKINGRSTTMVQIIHPVAHQDFRFHVARLFFDNELRIPIHFDAFLWPEQEGGDPPLEERYTYTNLKINNGFTARDFDATNNPEIFKK